MIIKPIFGRPDAEKIHEIVGAHTHVLALRVAEEDIGKVIGKGGAHAPAIRSTKAKHYPEC